MTDFRLRACVLLVAWATMCSQSSLAQGIPSPWNQEIQQLRHFGDLPVSTVSPTFLPSVIQADNNSPVRKIRPKESQEIHSNFVGTTPPRLPRSEAFDLQPFRRIHLIDGDDKSLWMSRGQAVPDIQPEWIRIDLPFEQPLDRIILRLMDDSAGGIPAKLTVQISRDANDWKTIEHSSLNADSQGVRKRIAPVNGAVAKQVRIIGQQLPLVSLASSEGTVGLGHGFCVRGVELISSAGENIALISKGAGVTVSSTNYGYGDKRSIHDMLWPIHYDLGVKHLKIAYWDDTLNWHYVETKKGEYQIDARTDEIITESVANGCEVYLTLCYGNWLYAEEGSNLERWRFWQFPFQKPPVPLTDTQIEAYCNFCRFMVRHFKGRIKYFEIWNEQNIPYAWPPDEVEAYCKLVKLAARAIKKENPDAKVMLGGVCFCDVPYFEKMFQNGVADHVDVICWHPYQWEVTPEESYRLPPLREGEKEYASYRDRVKAIQDMAVQYGFKGDEYHANETTWVSPYPAPDFPVPGGPVSEMVKAKYIARTIALHSDMGIPVYYNETWNTGIVYWDVSLLRATNSAEPQSPVWPQPAYYALRTMATITDGAQPVDVALNIDGPDVPYEHCRLRLGDGSTLVGVWLTQRARDKGDVYPATVTVGVANAKEVVGIDPINGSEQALRFTSAAGKTSIDRLQITDYPILLRIR